MLLNGITIAMAIFTGDWEKVWEGAMGVMNSFMVNGLTFLVAFGKQIILWGLGIAQNLARIFNPLIDIINNLTGLNLSNIKLPTLEEQAVLPPPAVTISSGSSNAVEGSNTSSQNTGGGNTFNAPLVGSVVLNNDMDTAQFAALLKGALVG